MHDVCPFPSPLASRGDISPTGHWNRDCFCALPFAGHRIKTRNICFFWMVPSPTSSCHSPHPWSLCTSPSPHATISSRSVSSLHYSADHQAGCHHPRPPLLPARPSCSATRLRLQFALVACAVSPIQRHQTPHSAFLRALHCTALHCTALHHRLPALFQRQNEP